MSRFILRAFVGLFLAALFLSMVADHAQGARRDEAYYFLSEGRRIYVTIDPATGCHYLLRIESSLTPRIASDGKSHLGCKDAKP